MKQTEVYTTVSSCKCVSTLCHRYFNVILQVDIPLFSRRLDVTITHHARLEMQILRTNISSGCAKFTYLRRGRGRKRPQYISRVCPSIRLESGDNCEDGGFPQSKFEP
jgi:hypothetical protein